MFAQQPIAHWTAEQARTWMEGRGHDEYNLIDVRQPGEFAEGHIPGARLVPLSELQEHLDEIDRERPTLVYCRMGGRGVAATSVLLANGFRDVANLQGGISAWRGQVVEGLPDDGLAWFRGTATAGELIVEAWALEEGALRFYAAAAEAVDASAAALFAQIGEAEDHHKAALVAMYRRVVGEPAPGLFSETVPPERMEGGVRLQAVLDWLPGRTTFDVLELALALETKAYDTYVQIERLVEGEDERRVLRALAEGERRHVAQIAAQLDRRAHVAWKR